MSTFDNLPEAQKELMEKLNKIGRVVVVKVFNKIIVESPVGNPSLWHSKPPPGYTGGRFRANWQASLGSTNAVGSVEATINGMNITDIVYLTNNLPYAEALEYGNHSTQRPNGWVRSSIATAQKVLDNAVAQLVGEG